MSTLTYLLIGLAAIAGIVLFQRLLVAFRQYWRLWGKMVIQCPETRRTEAVEVDCGRAALTGMAGESVVQLKSCSRWPERHDCDQDCLAQLERDPQSHRVWNMAIEWYAGKKCLYCGKPIDDLNHFDHPPALRQAGGKTIEWDEIEPEKLPAMLESCQPVCWNCHIAESFRHEHPELVVERPGR
jgi:hypothetical protein